jgi:antitoxin component YwqK of YwqJK toxin-antitoxin module
MNLRISLASAFWLFGSALTASAQSETEPVSLGGKYNASEEFSVLKADHTTRQGPYVRYKVVSGPRNEISLAETGYYERGQKEGEWRTFFDGRIFNRLASKGRYHAGLPEGAWAYYHRPAPGAASIVLFTGKKAEQGLSLDVNDTLAVVRAKGTYSRGTKVGLWKYYDDHAALIQAVNESTGQLTYWRPAAGPPLSGPDLAANHPVLCIGGKEQLLRAFFETVNPNTLRELGQVAVLPGQSLATDVELAIDSTGRRTGIALAGKAAPSQYEGFILTEVGRLPVGWLPQVVNGKAVASTYHVLVTTERLDKGGIRVSAKALGE